MKANLNSCMPWLVCLPAIIVTAVAAQAQVLDQEDLHPLDRTVLLSGVRNTRPSPAQKSDDQKADSDFAATLVLTDLAEAFPAVARSRKSSPADFQPFTVHDRKVPIVVSVSFKGASRDRQGAQDLTYDVRILRPDGTVHTGWTNLVAAQGQPSRVSRDPLSAREAIGVILAEKDPPGAYTVEAVVKDNLTKVALPLKQRFLVSE